ncbi:hypothetical protein Ddye_010944 [Dipteronia dyeriana]|uniref:Uncharacterized protein n=1 Tax=Dipteronia dyeriana TaxID=168575 RepID=A0AAD9XEM9_9ROSI|nr:hypothetical protein Ddye_010944 [Dipteronia dyeriana]
MEFGSPRGKEKSKSSSRGLVIGLDDNSGEFLHIQDSCERNTSEGNNINDVAEGIEDLKLNETKPGQKGLCKSNTFPSTGKVLPSAGSDEDVDEEPETVLQQMFSDEPMHSPYLSISLPTPLKLVSAMKGSREKLGAAPRKLTVKWAPDVYDPPPTIVSHTVNRSKKQQKLKKERNNKQKNGKKWQKGNSSRGSSGSKNKQYRKNAGCTEKSYNSLDVGGLHDDLHDFDVGGPDSYCGSSFLKESLTNLHYSVAEAL